MKNKEKYAKEIVEIACDGGEIAISKETRKPVSCDGCRCIDCALCEEYGCSNAVREWAESEYIEKPVISKMDRAFLDYLGEECKFIARDENGSCLCISENHINLLTVGKLIVVRMLYAKRINL